MITALFPASVVAQALGWQQVETRHFTFIFEPRDRRSVDELVGLCEEVYDKVTGFFHSYPSRVPCVIRGRRDDANGVTMSFPARIELYLTAPNDFFLGARTESWLKALLTHELTHFVHQSMSTGIFFAASHVFGADLSALSLDFLPGWSIEGPAVFDETQFTEGGRGRNPLFEMYTKAAVEDGSLYSLEQAAYDAAFPPPDRIYVAGYQLLDWLEGTYGAGTFELIMDDYLAFPFFGPWAAIRTVTGKSPQAVFKEMQDALRSRYASLAAVPGGRIITPKDRVGDWTRPQPTARGLYLYHTGPDVASAIVLWDAASGVETPLVRTVLADGSSFSATCDGQEIWFADMTVDATHPAEQRTVSDLSVYDRMSGATRRVTRGAHLWHPAVSADGATLLAVQSAGPYTRLVEVDEKTGHLRVLFSRASGNVYTPALSPDGKSVAFVFNLHGVQDLYVANLAQLRAGSRELVDVSKPVEDVNAEVAHPVLGPDAFGEYYPSFLDDQRVTFSSDRSGQLSLYVADISSGLVTLVQTDPVAALAAAPQGGDLLYASYASTGLCIKSVPIDRLVEVAITTTGPTPDAVQVLPGPALAPLPSSSYWDLPLPTVWLPTLIAAPAGASVLNWAAGPGIFTQGESLLGASSWQLEAGWLVGENQPGADLAFSIAVGQLAIAASAAYSYLFQSVWVESISDNLSLTWTPIAERALDTIHVLQLSIGLRHAAQLESNGAFTFEQSFAMQSSAWFSTIAIPLILSYSWSGASAPLDFNPRFAFDAWTSIVTYLPLLSITQTQYVIDAFSALNLPALGSHDVFKLGLKVSQNLGVSSAEYQDSFTVPRGFSAARTRSDSGGALASIDYLAPIGLLDQPLPFSLALTAAGFGIHLEALADFDPLLRSFAVSPRFFAGLDVSLTLHFNELVFPIGVGIAASVNTTTGSAFNAGTDIGVYFFSGFDSFGAAARQARDAPARP